MPKRPSKDEDELQAATRIVAQTTGQPPPKLKETPRSRSEEEKKLRSQAASILGKLGGPKGGRARAAKLSPEERARIASLAAKSRWDKKKES